MIKATPANTELLTPASTIDSANNASSSSNQQNAAAASTTTTTNTATSESVSPAPLAAPPATDSVTSQKAPPATTTTVTSASSDATPVSKDTATTTSPVSQQQPAPSAAVSNDQQDDSLSSVSPPLNPQQHLQHQHQFQATDDAAKDHIVPNAKTTTTTQSNGAITTKQNMSTPTCKNCKTQTTPLWRRDETGQVLCNACGLFLKLHGRPRPISLKSDVIKSRNRVKHSNKSSPNTPELKAKDHASSANTNGNSANSHHMHNSNSNSSMNNAMGNNNLSNNNSGNSINGIPNTNMLQNGGVPGIHNINNNNSNNKISSKFLPKQYKPNNKAPKVKRTEKGGSPKESSKIVKVGANGLPKANKLMLGENGMNGSITSPNLLPLLPRGQGQTLPPGTPYTYASTTAWMNKNQGTSIQSLHYPSSTPTQFVSNLNRITSPLLLSTTTPPKLNPTPSQSQSSERSSSVNNNLNRDAVLNAAGALEILSQQATATDYIPGIRLNSPHATPLSKPTSIADKLPPLSLLSKDTKPIPNEPTHLHNILSPPTKDNNNVSGSIKPPSPMSSIPRHFPNEQMNTTLPPLNVLSPSLQPQQQSQQLQQQQTQQQQIPPQSQLPSLKNVPGISSVMYNSNNNSNNNNEDSKHVNADVSLLNIGSINDASNANHHTVLHEENEKLRTRISELELVNDLYKTRISELEEVDAKFQKAESDYRRQIRELEYSLQQHAQAHIKHVQTGDDLKLGEKRQAAGTEEDHVEKRIKVEN